MRKPVEKAKEPGEDQLLDVLAKHETREDLKVLAGTAQPLPAGTPLDDAVRNLARVQADKGRWNSGTAAYRAYEDLRDTVTDALEAGPLYYLDEHNVRRVAVRQQAVNIEVDVDLLMQYIHDKTLLDQVAPRKVDAAAFKAAVFAKRIPGHVLVKVATEKPSAAHVKFITPDM